MISTVKRAEDGDALIVRLYEYAGRGEKIELQIREGFVKAQLVNLLERRPSPLPISDRSMQLEMKPFKLVTVRLER
jgi:alpha-mannosidase